MVMPCERMEGPSEAVVDVDWIKVHAVSAGFPEAS